MVLSFAPVRRYRPSGETLTQVMWRDAPQLATRGKPGILLGLPSTDEGSAKSDGVFGIES
jgi:hypothetical protein